MSCGGSTVVEDSTTVFEIKGLNPAIFILHQEKNEREENFYPSWKWTPLQTQTILAAHGNEALELGQI